MEIWFGTLVWLTWLLLSLTIVFGATLIFMFFHFWKFKKAKAMKTVEVVKKKGIPFYYKKNTLSSSEANNSIFSSKMKILFLKFSLLFDGKELNPVDNKLSAKQQKHSEKIQTKKSKIATLQNHIITLQTKPNPDKMSLEEKIIFFLNSDSHFKNEFLKSNLAPSTTESEIKDNLRKFPEEVARFNFLFKLLNEGFDLNRINFELPVKMGSKTVFVDITIHDDTNNHTTENAVCFIEMKKSSTTDLTEATKQLHSYLSATPNIKYGIVSNSKTDKFFVKKTELDKISFVKTENFLSNVKEESQGS